MKNAIGGSLKLVMMPVFLLWPAGDWLWPEAWAMMGLLYAMMAWNLAWLLKHDRELLRERLKPDLRKDENEQKGWDRVLMKVYIPYSLVWIFLPSLDHRFGWSSLGGWSLWAGLGLTFLGMVGVHWCMRANRYLSRVVRIQEGHRVIEDGPYAIVRHPMYSTVSLTLVGFPMALDSLWGLYGSAGMALLLVVRTYLEDKTLQAELEGYADYAKNKTRYRLVPGVW